MRAITTLTPGRDPVHALCMRCLLITCLIALSAPLLAQDAPTPHWIWHPDPDAGQTQALSPGRVLLETRIDIPGAVRSAEWHLAADNHFVAFVANQRVGEGHDWTRGLVTDVGDKLRAGEQRLWAVVWNDGGPAGFVGRLVVTLEDGTRWTSVTDASWKASIFRDPESKPARPVADLGPLGSGLWGNRVRFARRSEELAPLPGFRVQEIASGLGSLICLTDGEDGALFVGVEGAGIRRLTDVDGDGTYETVEEWCPSIKSAQGLEVVYGKLHAVGAGPEGVGLYRIAPDARDRPELLGKFTGGMGEHGPHAVVHGPDDRLWLAIGNHAGLAAPWSEESPYRLHAEDTALPVVLDPSGHARKIRSPGGIIVSVDREGKDWRVVAGGLRNAYDIAFHANGALFAWDSDMEWDLGLPWYRPTRLYHVVPGADFGWRTGTGKWPETAPDAFPAVLEPGRGSPTGLVYYHHTRFPKRFHRTLIAADWAQGRIIACRLTPDGGSFVGRHEVLLSGRPLNVTDLVVDGDGDLIFTTGGRGTRGAVFRLRYEGGIEGENPSARKEPTRVSPHGVPTAAHPAPYDGFPAAMLGRALDSEHRTMRYLAARALERKPADETLPGPATAMGRAELAIARLRRGDVGVDPEPLLTDSVDEDLPRETRAAAMRALEIGLARGLVTLDAAQGAPLLATWPTGDAGLDRSLSTLIALSRPDGGLEKLVAAIASAPNRTERIHLAHAVSAWKGPWPERTVAAYMGHFAEALTWNGGHSFEGYVKELGQRAARQWSEEDRARLAALASTPREKRERVLRASVRRDAERLTEFLANSLGDERRSLAEGSRIFEQACASCHAFDGQGRGLGPDLTSVASRFALKDLVDSIVHPSRVVSDQYRGTDLFTLDGLQTGQVIRENDEELVLLLRTGEEEVIPVADIEERRPSELSVMPEGLLDTLSQEEIADLVAYLVSGRKVEPAKESAWKPLFTTGQLTGWKGQEGLWSLQGRELRGLAENLESSTALVSDAVYGDFTIQFEILLEDGNSGLFFRADRTGPHTLRGYQADVGDRFWGSLYEEGGRGLLQLAPAVDWRPGLDPAGFNHVVVEAHGERLRLTLNGVPTVVMRDAQSLSGHLGFQLHSGDRAAIRVRHVLIRTP